MELRKLFFVSLFSKNIFHRQLLFILVSKSVSPRDVHNIILNKIRIPCKTDHFLFCLALVMIFNRVKRTILCDSWHKISIDLVNAVLHSESCLFLFLFSASFSIPRIILSFQTSYNSWELLPA